MSSLYTHFRRISVQNVISYGEKRWVSSNSDGAMVTSFLDWGIIVDVVWCGIIPYGWSIVYNSHHVSYFMIDLCGRKCFWKAFQNDTNARVHIGEHHLYYKIEIKKLWCIFAEILCKMINQWSSPVWIRPILNTAKHVEKLFRFV